MKTFRRLVPLISCDENSTKLLNIALDNVDIVFSTCQGEAVFFNFLLMTNLRFLLRSLGKRLLFASDDRFI